MARVTATQGADKWARNLGAATEDIKNGVNGVTVSPGVLAARNADAWLQNTIASKDKWVSRVGAVDVNDWKDKMINVGIPRVASGASANKPKMEAFLTDFLPFLDRVTATTKAMPNTTLDDRINRMVSQVRGVSAYKRGK